MILRTTDEVFREGRAQNMSQEYTSVQHSAPASGSRVADAGAEPITHGPAGWRWLDDQYLNADEATAVEGDGNFS